MLWPRSWEGLQGTTRTAGCGALHSATRSWSRWDISGRQRWPLCACGIVVFENQPACVFCKRTLGVYICTHIYCVVCCCLCELLAESCVQSCRSQSWIDLHRQTYRPGDYTCSASWLCIYQHAHVQEYIAAWSISCIYLAVASCRLSFTTGKMQEPTM